MDKYDEDFEFTEEEENALSELLLDISKDFVTVFARKDLSLAEQVDLAGSVVTKKASRLSADCIEKVLAVFKGLCIHYYNKAN